MMSPDAVRATEHAGMAEERETRSAPTRKSTNPPYAPRRPRAANTLPTVTSRQHRIAAFAGGAATLFALAGFGALVIYAPRGDRIKEVETAEFQKPVVATAAAPPAKPVALPDTTATAAAKTATLTAAPEPIADKPEAKAVALETASPRWGDTPAASEEKAEALAEAQPSGTENPLPTADDANAAPPVQAFAEDDAQPRVESAGAKAIEAQIDDEAAEPTDSGTTAAIPAPEAPATGRQAKVKTAVNLRARGADEAKVLRVIPAKASLTVIACKGWCEVEYEGTRGYIYKSFIR